MATEIVSSPSSKYLIFRTSPIGGSSGDLSNMVLYDSVKMTNIEDENPDEVFRVFSESTETERLFRTKSGGDVQYIKIVRQPSMELATLPPPRSNILYLITEYDTIRNPLFTLFADKKVHICTSKDNDFRSIKSKLNEMEHTYNSLLTSGNSREILNNIYTGTLSGDTYVTLDVAHDHGISKPSSLVNTEKNIKTVGDLIKKLGEKSPDWIVILDIDNNVSNTMFDNKGFVVKSGTLSLDPSPAPTE
jgi:hypothetical protein